MRIISVFLFIMLFAVELTAATPGTSSADSSGEQQITQFQDHWFAKDKVHHLAASAFLTGFGYYAANKELNYSHKTSTTFSVSLSFSCGILKECYDGTLGKSKPSYKDIIADLAGIGIGLILLNAENK